MRWAIIGLVVIFMVSAGWFFRYDVIPISGSTPGVFVLDRLAGKATYCLGGFKCVPTDF